MPALQPAFLQSSTIMLYTLIALGEIKNVHRIFFFKLDSVDGKTEEEKKGTRIMDCFVIETHKGGRGYTLYCRQPAEVLDQWLPFKDVKLNMLVFYLFFFFYRHRI